MKLYPNPSKSTTYVSVPEEFVKGCNLTVTNTQGDLIFEQQYPEFGNTIIPLDLGNQPSGLYRVTINNEAHAESNDLLLLSRS